MGPSKIWTFRVIVFGCPVFFANDLFISCISESQDVKYHRKSHWAQPFQKKTYLHSKSWEVLHLELCVNFFWFGYRHLTNFQNSNLYETSVKVMAQVPILHLVAEPSMNWGDTCILQDHQMLPKLGWCEWLSAYKYKDTDEKCLVFLHHLFLETVLSFPNICRYTVIYNKYPSTPAVNLYSSNTNHTNPKTAWKMIRLSIGRPILRQNHYCNSVAGDVHGPPVPFSWRPNPLQRRQSHSLCDLRWVVTCNHQSWKEIKTGTDYKCHIQPT